ncbi:MAG: FHA domain-containing protein [Holdemanella sp.]|nr:FHA domain-containing protein [Holdemanella sp.]
MKRVLVLDKQNCYYFTFQNSHSFKALHFIEKKDSIHIDETYELDMNQSILIDAYTIMHLESDWCWSLIKNDGSLSIGRDYDNDLVLSHPSISNHHAIIQNGILEDLQSTNGTYVNQERIESVRLKAMDEIWIVDTCILYFHDFMIVNKPMDSYEIPYIEPEEIEYEIKDPVDTIQFSTEVISIESFISDTRIKKQGWFQSIGSSIMILFSSAISILIMYCIQPGQIVQLVSMVMMSLSMSISFMLYGLYSRNYNWKMQKEEMEDRHNLYKQYLQSITTMMTEKMKQYEMECRKLKDECIHLNHSFLKYPSFLIGFEKKELFTIQSKHPGYQNMEHPLYKYLENWKQEQEVCTLHPIWFEKDKITSIRLKEGVVEMLFLRYAYSSIQQKVVILSRQAYPFLSHPLCTYKMHRLWIHDEESYKQIEPLCSEEMIYFILDEYYYSCLKEKCHTGILFLEKEGMDIDVVAYDLNTYRETLQYALDYQQEISSLPYFRTERKKDLNLKVCLGFDEKKNPIEMDFSEKGHGPHGLVAGSTGSGKSELLSSILMQLVLQNTDENVQLIVIDFKGGALGNIFKSFPHLKGFVTNLEKKDINRFIISMDAILEQRQQKLASFQKRYSHLPSHIDVYNQYEKPISHLFLVVDELAQLKNHFPEVIPKLKEIARIGRSLGIHLILSTQKPTGVVDDQIWANSSFQICLKVANSQDSREILHNDMAAYLKETGEFIFQSGISLQKKGKGLYLQQCIDESESIEVNSYDIPIQEIPSTTILDSILENQKPFSPDWLICPSLSEYAFQNENIIYDDIYHRIQPEYIFDRDPVCFITSDMPKLSKLLIGYLQFNPIGTYKLSFDEYVDIHFHSLNDLTHLHSIKDPCTFLVYIEFYEDLLYWSEYLFHETIRIILILDHMDTKYVKILSRIPVHSHYHWMDKEWVYLYYANAMNVRDAMHYENGICMDTVVYEMKLNESKKMDKRKESRIHLEKEKRIPLGFSKSHQKVYRDESRSLLVCYVQQSVKHKIDELFKGKTISYDMEEDFDICILNLIEDSTSLSSKAYLLKQFDVDVLWVGQGFMEYGYGLKRKCYETGIYDMIYWHKQECILLDWS